MSKVTPSLNSPAARAAAFKAIRDRGDVPDRDAGLVVFPEISPDTVEVNTQALPVLPDSIDEQDVPGHKVSQVMLERDIRQDIVAKGLSPETAKTIASGVASFVPESGSIVEYKKVADLVRSQKQDLTVEPVEAALRNSKIIDDIELAGHVMYAALGNGQQALYGLVAGEGASDVGERLWPHADIRDDDGTVERKAVVPQALKIMAQGVGGLVLDTLHYGITGKTPLSDMARKGAEALITDDYRQNMLTAMEVTEYWMHGEGLFGTKLPEQGTPERAAFDAQVFQEVGDNYAALSDEKFGGLAMAGMALGQAVSEVMADPGLWLSGVPSKSVELGRKVLPVSSRARVTGAIAEKTGRLDQLLVAYNDAKEWMRKSGDTYFSETTHTNKARYAHAQKTVARLKARLDSHATGPAETFLLPTNPRIRPEHIRDVRAAYKSVPRAGRYAAMNRFINEKVTVAKREVKKLEKAIERAEHKSPDLQLTMFTEEQMGADLAQLKTRLQEAITTRDAWKETRRWAAKETKVTGSRTTAFLDEAVNKMETYEPEVLGDTDLAGEVVSRKAALSQVLDNIRRGVAQGADESEIIQWEHTYTKILNTTGDEIMGPITRSRVAADDILYETMADQRRIVLGEDPTPVADYGKADPQQAVQRAVLGPDQREAAGEAAKVLAAGGEIDDIAYHGMSVDLYNSSYGEQLFPLSGNETRAGVAEWLGVDAMNTKIEAAQWQQTLAEKHGDLWAKALYPGTWNIRPAGMLYGLREPMRVLQSANPKLYTRIHNALDAQKFELTRMNEVFSRELKILGVYKEVNGSYVLNPEASKKFYQVMNLVPGSEKYELALSGLTETERRSLRRLRQELDFVGDKLGLRNTDKYIEGYIDHVWDKHWTDHGARMQEVRGLGASTDVRNTHLMDRAGNTGYVEDLALALDTYARNASRKLHFEPMFKDMEAAKNAHLLLHPGDEWFAQYLDHMINNFKGRPSTLGQWVDLNLASLNARMRAHETVMNTARGLGTVYEKQGNVMGRIGQALSPLPGKFGKLGGAMESEGVRISEFGSQMKYNGMPLYNIGDASRTAMGVTALIYSSVLGGSGRYFPMAVATGLATTGSKYGIFGTLRGILKMATPDGRALAKQAGLDKQWVQIMEDAAWTKIGKLATNMPTFNGVTVVGPSISATENMIRGWTYHAAMGDLMRKHGFTDWDEVVEAGFARAYLHEALRTTEEVNHLFGQLGKPPAFHRTSKSGSVAATQFLSFIPKQTEELLAQTLENPGKIAQYMMISGYLQRVAAKVGLDISDYVGTGFLPSSPDEATSISFEVMEAMMAHGNEMGKLAAGVGNADQATRASERLTRAMTNFIPLAIASQRATRTFNVLRTGSLYAEDGALVYPFDLGGFEWDNSETVGSNLMRSYSPEFLGQPGAPSEMLALKSGLNSPRQVTERQQYRAMRTMAATRIHRRRQIAQALQRMVDNGDSKGFDHQLALADKEGMLPPDLGRMLDRSQMEAALPRLMLEQTDSDQAMLDAATTLPMLQAIYELKFNVEGGR